MTLKTETHSIAQELAELAKKVKVDTIVKTITATLETIRPGLLAVLLKTTATVLVPSRSALDIGKDGSYFLYSSNNNAEWSMEGSLLTRTSSVNNSLV